ncbi:DUF3572 domain-containing protein [soil metagenome]
MQRQAAEDIAREALIWLAAEPGRMARFLAETGAAPASLGGLARDPGFLGAVLDFVLADEARLLAFAAACGIAPDAPARARRAMPGGDLPHWT